MKILLSTMILAIAFQANAISKIHVMEKCTHAIMKLAKAGEIPAEAASKTHMMRVKETATGFEVLAVLDHNEDHSQPAAHVKFNYDVNGKMVDYTYVAGYVNPAATSFTKASAALLFDLGTEIVFEGTNPELLAYAEGVYMVELSYLAPSDQASFGMIDGNKKVLELITDLEGNYVSHKFEQL